MTMKRMVLGAVVAAALAIAIAAAIGGLRAAQLTVGVVLVLASWAVESRRTGRVPVVLRPFPVALSALLVASIGTAGFTSNAYSVGGLTGSEYRTYALMWVLQAVGFGFGGLLAYRLMPDAPEDLEPRPLNYDRMRLLAFIGFGVSLLMAAVYFATEGIPALGSDIEQSRVDAAQGGSGYVRLVAFLMPTVALMLIAVWRKRWSWAFAAVAVVFMLGVGNRIPLVYFAFPLVVLFAIVGRRVKSVQLVAIGALMVVLVGALGAYRIASQDEFRHDALYMDALARGDYVDVAVTAVAHYAEVIPENAILVKDLVDSGEVDRQWGRSYFTLFVSALPGEQQSPDMMLKEASGKDFIGGGIPPTLAGEGYMNFWYPGVVLNAMAVMFLLRWTQRRVERAGRGSDATLLRIDAVIYGYVVTWSVFAQISGFAGSATVSLAAFLALVAWRLAGQVKQPASTDEPIPADAP